MPLDNQYQCQYKYKYINISYELLFVTQTYTCVGRGMGTRPRSQKVRRVPPYPRIEWPKTGVFSDFEGKLTPLPTIRLPLKNPWQRRAPARYECRYRYTKCRQRIFTNKRRRIARYS